MTSRKKKKKSESELLFQKDYSEWLLECDKIKSENAKVFTEWETKKKEIENKNDNILIEWKKSVEKTRSEIIARKAWWEKNCDQARLEHSNNKMKEWEIRKAKYYEKQKANNAEIDKNRENYMARDPGAIIDYCDSVLSNSLYPDFFPKEWDIDYIDDSRTLIIEYILPEPNMLPSVKEVKYIQSKDNFKETFLSDKEKESLYDDLLYQVTIRTIHEIFEADVAEAIDSVAFNGLVTSIDKTTGHNVTTYILSIQAKKEIFEKINLADVDPKACFQSLKGISASKLVGLAAIAPVLMIDKSDRRFIDSYAVADTINSGTNLATMDWEDFEHLIRELFEKEFMSGGGEVKVTQASRDGGVDAIAFDPDPIRGGKIVIQAKRYANTVGVSAVRDLYGTVINEGATKGVLVTTANYGPDAYEFAKGKPLSLLNGSNLLHLLEKHGWEARINLQEAKQVR